MTPFAVCRRTGHVVDYRWSYVHATRLAVLYGPGHYVQPFPRRVSQMRRWMKENPQP